MADNFKELWNSFREVTNKTLERNKDRPVLRLLNTTVKSLEGILKAIDVFLKEKNIDVGKLYESTKDKGKSLLDKSKTFIENIKKTGLKVTTANIISKVKDKFTDFTEKETGPPNENEEPSSLRDQVETLKNLVKEKLTPKTSTGQKTSWLDRAKERSDKRKQEIEKEKQSVQDNSKKKKSGTWLNSILNGIIGLGGMLVKGIGGIMSTVTSGIVGSIQFLGGFIVKGISNALFSLVPSLAGGIAKATSALASGGIASAAKVGWEGIKLAGKSALPFLGKAGGALLRGVGMIATGPVGWTIAAGTAIYGGYKLYKYLNRNNIKDDIYGKLTLLRLYSYGFNDINKEYYSKLFDLEMLMKDYLKFSNHQVQINRLDKDVIEKVLELFSVTREEKDKYAILNNWFMKRFIPAYKAHVTAIWSVNNSIYLDTIDKLHQEDLENIIVKLNIPTSIYNVNEIPVFSNPKTIVTKQDVDVLLTNISNEIASKKKKDKTPVEKAAEQNKQYQAKQQMQNNEVKTANNQAAEAAKPAALTTTNTTNQSTITKLKEETSPDQEGEAKPAETTPKQDVEQVQTKVQGKLNLAQGDIVPGGMDLTGITTKLDKTKIYNLDPNMRELFTGMAKEYHALTGKSINVNEAFRSYEDQADLYRRMPNRAAKPGNSTHEFGLAVDINSTDTQELDRLGLLRKYGFSTSIGGEKWHIEPIGVTMNPTLAKKDPNFRFKAIQASPGKGGGGYGLLENSKLKKRDIPYQVGIYNSNSETPIDLEKMKASTVTTFPDTQVKKALQESTDKGVITPSTTISSVSNTTTSTTPSAADIASKTTNSTNSMTYSPDQEGETRPNITTTTTPIKPTEKTPTLDTSTNAVPNTSSNMDLAKYSSLSPIEAIKQAAKMTGMDENILINFAKLESSLDPNAKAKTSSASGLFQIVDGTWKELIQKHGSKYGIDASVDKNNPFYNALMGAEYAKQNLQGLRGYKEAGVEADTALYMAHFLGLGGANKFFAQLNKDPNAPVQSAVSEASYRANQSLMKDKTVGGLLQVMANKIDKASGTSYASYNPSASNANGYASSTGNVQNTFVANSKQTQTTPSTSTGLMTAGLTTSASTPSTGLMKASYKPTISNSRMDISSPTPITQPSPSSIPTSTSNYSEMFNTGKMEGILSEQLTTLTQIATILTGMSDKFDLSKLTDSLSGAMNNIPNITKEATGQLQTGMQQFKKLVPETSINLSRKKITT